MRVRLHVRARVYGERDEILAVRCSEDTLFTFVVFLSFIPIRSGRTECKTRRTDRQTLEGRGQSMTNGVAERRWQQIRHVVGEVLILRSAHPCYFKQRHKPPVAFATRTHHTLLENVQILPLSPSFGSSFPTFYFSAFFADAPCLVSTGL